jgi:hypothetical protein
MEDTNATLSGLFHIAEGVDSWVRSKGGIMIGTRNAKKVEEEFTPQSFRISGISHSYLEQNPRLHAGKPSSDYLNHGTGQSCEKCHKFWMSEVHYHFSKTKLLVGINAVLIQNVLFLPQAFCIIFFHLPLSLTSKLFLSHVPQQYEHKVFVTCLLQPFRHYLFYFLAIIMPGEGANVQQKVYYQTALKITGIIWHL